MLHETNRKRAFHSQLICDPPACLQEIDVIKHNLAEATYQIQEMTVAADARQQELDEAQQQLQSNEAELAAAHEMSQANATALASANAQLQDAMARNQVLSTQVCLVVTVG